MKRFFSLIVALLVLNTAFAVEGMWVLSLIQRNYNQMRKLGLKLSPEDIYSVNHSSLKDVVVALDGGSCTAEVVSPNGLLFTNHHCGYEEIQKHSTVEHDYLKNGFWANSYDEELPNPGKEAWFLVRMEDVTDSINFYLKGINSEEKREDIIAEVSQRLTDRASEDGKYYAEVKDFYDGNQYFLFVYLIYKDVRLVGAPPNSIGKFGGDTDNWMWPRHTGDFTIFRIYAKPDGTPAEYSPDNVPLKTPKYLKISIKGINEGDYAMIMGYPGTTNRYLTSWEVMEVRDHENAIRIKVREQKLNILKKFMDSSDELRIKYAANYAQCANYYKYSIGQNLGIKRLKVIEQKQQIEKDLKNWIAADKSRAKYAKMFKLIRKSLKKHAKEDIALNYWFETIYLGSDFVSIALKTLRFFNQYLTAEDRDKLLENFRTDMKLKYKDFDPEVDKTLFKAMLKMYLDNVPKEYYPSFVKSKDFSIEKYADYLYENSVFASEDKFMNALDNNILSLTTDPVISYTKEMLGIYFAITKKKDAEDVNLKKGRRLYMDAYLQMRKEQNPDYIPYPDANSTMRLTYGTVKGYTWEDKTYKYYTTIDGYIEKGEKYKDNPEFEMDPKLVELYNKKDFGRYADKDGTLHLCFLTDNDITGGNSGSPVLDAEGNLIGLAFDGNWEAMSGDIIFEEPVQRTICVDVRFVLFVIDKVANDQHIMNELTIIE